MEYIATINHQAKCSMSKFDRIINRSNTNALAVEGFVDYLLREMRTDCLVIELNPGIFYGTYGAVL